MRLLAILLLATTAFAQQQMVRRGARAPEAVIVPANVTVPFTTPRHLPLVEVRVNGEGPFKFELDTGHSGHLTLSADLAKKLQLEKIGEAMSSDPSGKNVQRRDTYRVASLQLGEAQFDGLVGTIMPAGMGREADGILGFGLFRELLLTIDYPNKQLRVSRGSLPEVDGKRVLALRNDRPVPMVEIEAGGQKMFVDIDAGSPGAITLPLSVAKQLTLKGEPRVIGKGRTISGEFDVLAADVDGVIRVGSIDVKNPTIDVVDHFPHGNLGSRFLRQYAVTFDAKNGRVEFGR
jgi:predicted aspartyl protease